MIDAKQLRIGNWVLDSEGVERQVTVISAQGRVFLPPVKYVDRMPKIVKLGEDCSTDLIHPIPLTPEVLEACEGFTKYEWFEGYFKKTKFGDFMIRLYEGEIHCFFTNITYDNMGMKFSGKRYIGNLNATQNIIYLHQLQNFLAICGQELEYKPKV